MGTKKHVDFLVQRRLPATMEQAYLVLSHHLNAPATLALHPIDQGKEGNIVPVLGNLVNSIEICLSQSGADVDFAPRLKYYSHFDLLCIDEFLNLATTRDGER